MMTGFFFTSLQKSNYWTNPCVCLNLWHLITFVSVSCSVVWMLLTVLSMTSIPVLPALFFVRFLLLYCSLFQTSSAACCILFYFFSCFVVFVIYCFVVLLSYVPVLPALSWPEKYQPLHSSEIIGNSAVVKRLRAWLLEWKQCLDKEAKRAKLMMMKEKKKSHKEEGECSNRLLCSWVFSADVNFGILIFKLCTFYVSDLLIDVLKKK